MGVVALYSSFPAVVDEFLSSCNTKDKTLHAGFFSGFEYELVKQIANTLLPATSTPSASDVTVPYFIELVIKNCMSKWGLPVLHIEMEYGENEKAMRADMISSAKEMLESSAPAWVIEVDTPAVLYMKWAQHAWAIIPKLLY